MNTERLLREIEKRLTHLPESDRAEVVDAVREEVARERRRLDPSPTIEGERERRLEAETLREVLEAINRQARLEDTIQEVLKQLSRVVLVDSCSVALVEPDGRFRIIAGRGFPDVSKILGIRFRDEFTDAVRANPRPVALADVQGDPRFVQIEGSAAIRSWALIPLFVEGDVIGAVSLDRHRVDPFAEEELHHAKAVAFSAAAAIRKARLLEQIRRYASLMERVVDVDQAVFAGRPPSAVGRAILDGALRLGPYRGGLLVLDGAGGPRVVAAAGLLADALDRSAPQALAAKASVHLDAAAVEPIAAMLGVAAPGVGLHVVPLASAESHLGALCLLDPDGDTPDDRLLEAYASRTSAAYVHSLRAERRG